MKTQICSVPRAKLGIFFSFTHIVKWVFKGVAKMYIKSLLHFFVVKYFVAMIESQRLYIVQTCNKINRRNGLCQGI